MLAAHEGELGESRLYVYVGWVMKGCVDAMVVIPCGDAADVAIWKLLCRERAWGGGCGG